MGYYSQVALKTTTEGYITLKNKFDEQKCTLLDSFDVHHTADGYTRIYNPWIKFYDEFPEVKLFRDCLNYFLDNDIAYSYIKIGEDLDDITTELNDPDGDDAINLFEPIVKIIDDYHDESEFIKEEKK